MIQALLIALAIVNTPAGPELTPIVVEFRSMHECRAELKRAKAHPNVLLADCFDTRSA